MSNPEPSSTQPPTSSPHHAAGSTPAKSRRTAVDIEYRAEYLTPSRAAVLRDLGKVPEMPIENMLKMFLPASISSDFVDRILVDLEDRQIVRANKWTDFDPQPSDHKNKQKEPQYFQERIPKLQREILTSVKSLNQHSLASTVVDLKMAGSTTPYSKRHNTSKPDGYYVLQDAEKDDWDNIAIPIEVKKRAIEREVRDNTGKILWSMHHIMRSDPCRRFTFGITVENLSMRLWVCDRSLVTVSSVINLNQDRGLLITLIVALNCATKVQLGYDPTIRRVLAANPNREAVYHIEVQPTASMNEASRVFETVETLSDVGAEAFQGRGTRVWKVKEVINGVANGPLSVLKDCWVNSDRSREGDTIRKIVDTLPPDSELRQHFFTIVTHGDVIFGNQRDNTDNIHHQQTPPAKMRSIDLGPVVALYTGRTGLTISVTSDTSSSGTGSLPFVLPENAPFNQHGIHSNRQHYRIVVAEVGVPVAKLADRKSMMIAVGGALAAITAMHGSEHVHRDISSGNVFLVQRKGKPIGVLGDLEYAVQLGVESIAHGVRTGTPFFMACEVAATRYLRFEPRTGPKGFTYNRLHDLESIWWLCVWCVTYTCAHDYDPSPEHLRVLANDLFPLSAKQKASREMVLSQGLSRRAGELPDLPAIEVLNQWGLSIWDLYEQAEGSNSAVDYEVTIRALNLIFPFLLALDATLDSSPVMPIPNRLHELQSLVPKTP